MCWRTGRRRDDTSTSTPPSPPPAVLLKIRQFVSSPAVIPTPPPLVATFPHILHDVEKVCKEAIIVNNGQIVVRGTLESLLSQGERRKAIKVKGTTDRIKSFIDQLGRDNQIISVTDHFGLATIVFVNRGGSGPILELAHSTGVQVRSYLPDRITLPAVGVFEPGKGSAASIHAVSWSSRTRSCGKNCRRSGSWPSWFLG